MSVNGRPDEGDVYLDADGYITGFFKNSNGCWYQLYLSPESKGNTMWLSDAKKDAYAGGKHMMNIKDLLISIRKELQDESSS